MENKFKKNLVTILFGAFTTLITFIPMLNSPANTAALGVTFNTPTDPVLEVSLSTNVLNLNLTPNPNTPTFGTADLTVTAGTNNLTGYSLSMQVANSTLTRTTELESHPLNAPTIPSLAVRQEGYTESSFTRNHWGYKLSSDTNYLAIPESLALSSSSEPTNGNSTTITFASKVDMTLPAGSYSTDINFVAVSNTPIPTLQDVSNWEGSLIAGQAILAKDERDNEYYHVAKLADNRIWMLDNLAIDIADSAILNNMTSLNTNASNNTLNYLKNGGGTENDRYPLWEVAEANVFVYFTPIINMADKDALLGDVSANSQGYNKVGGQYNFCAASAGSYCYGMPEAEPGHPSGNAVEDICPAGWRLPTSGENSGEFWNLFRAYNGNYSSFTDAFSFTSTSYGYFWSNTGGNNYGPQIVYALEIRGNNAGVEPADWGERSNTNSIRCITKQPDVTITFDANGGEGTMDSQSLSDVGGDLNTNEFTYDGYAFAGWNTHADGSGAHYADGAFYQGSSTTLYAQWAMDIRDFDATLCYESAYGHPAFVVDTRNDRVYSVQYSDDDVCWMNQNLILESGTELTYEDSAIDSSYTIPSVSLGNNTISEDAVTYIYDEEDEITNAIYNYCTVSGGYACYENAQHMGATYSICPLNWRLPTQQEAVNMLMAPFDTFATNEGGGYYDYGISDFHDTETGYWWVFDVPPAVLYFGPYETNLSTDFAYGNGAAIRCVRTN